MAAREGAPGLTSKQRPKRTPGAVNFGTAQNASRRLQSLRGTSSDSPFRSLSFLSPPDSIRLLSCLLSLSLSLFSLALSLTVARSSWPAALGDTATRARNKQPFRLRLPVVVAASV